jgi:hypothetical protein
VTAIFGRPIGQKRRTPPRQLATNHPANPEAPESSQASATAFLMADGQGLMPALSTNQMEMQHAHPQRPQAKGGKEGRFFHEKEGRAKGKGLSSKEHWNC